MIEWILRQLQPEQTRAFLLLLEFYLLAIPPVLVFLSNRKKFDSFHPIIIFSAAFSLFYFFPQVYYYFFEELYLFSGNLDLAIASLAWTNVALLAFYTGYLISTKIGFIPKFSFKPIISPAKFLIILATLLITSILGFIYLIESSGGLAYYLTNQDKTIDLTAGKIYFVWAALLVRTSFLVHFIYMLHQWKQGHINGYIGLFILLMHAILAGVLVTAIGARILVASFAIEVLVLTHYAVRRVKLWNLVKVGLLGFIVVVIIMGAWRNYGAEGERRDRSFGQYLVDDVSQNLGRRLFNNYFDSVKNFVYALEYTGEGLPIQWGRTYLAVLVQPIPRDYRPATKLPIGPEMDGIYCGSPKGGDYCGIDPLLGELYQNFVQFGIPIGLFVFGFITNTFYRWLVQSVDANHLSYLLYGIYVYSVFFLLRGAFIGHTSFILMDLVPLLILQPLFSSYKSLRRDS